MGTTKKQGRDSPAPKPERLLAGCRQNVRRVLKDFETGSGDSVPRGGTTLPIDANQLPVPNLVQWVLTWGLGARDFGKEEKRAWLIPFVYKGNLCALGHYKFGLRLHVEATGQEAEAIASSVSEAIDTALRVIERGILLEYAEAQVSTGNVTVENQYHTYNNMYWYFRSKLETSEVTAASAMAGNGEVSLEAAIAAVNRRAMREHERFYESAAMLNSYFSVLEHLLVLIWPLVGKYRPAVDDLEKMILSRWSEKFKAVFDVSTDDEAKQIYDSLRDVAEDYRNTYSHGGFGKRRGALFVHFPGGAIPASLSETRRRLRTSFFRVPAPHLQEILRILDEADEWLRSGPASMAIRFVDAGMDVPFDVSSLDEIRSRMTTDEDFGNYLEGRTRWQDDQVNMDW